MNLAALIEDFGDIYPQLYSFDYNESHDPNNGRFISNGGKVVTHLKSAISDKSFKETLKLGKVQNAQEIQRLTKFSVKNRVVSANNLRHAYNTHGEGARILKPDEVRLTDKDFENYPDIVDNPDIIHPSPYLSGGGYPSIIYGKKDSTGHLIIVEEVLYGGILGFKTMYKTKVKPSWWK
jgi:hypothetical protein